MAELVCNVRPQSLIYVQFEVLNVKKLVLEQVYVNGIHALRQLDIRNNSSQSICIKLRSSLGSQIVWQLENENLASNIESVSPDSSSSSLSSLCDNKIQYPQRFNQLFNMIGHVDRLVIEPLSTEKIILAFLPDKKNVEKLNGGGAGQDGDVFVQSNENSRDSSFDFHEIKGLLFFFGYINNTTRARGLSGLQAVGCVSNMQSL